MAFLEPGKNGLTKDTHHNTTTDEVRHLEADNDVLKLALAESVLAVQRLKKAWVRKGEVSPHECPREDGDPSRGDVFAFADHPSPGPSGYVTQHLLPVAA